MTRYWLSAVVIPMLAFAAPARAAHPYSQEIIDQALAEAPLKFVGPADGMASEATRRATALYLLSLAAYQDPQGAGAAGSLITARILEHVRSTIQSGNEPNCSGALTGRAHCTLAQSFTLAKRNPAVWNALTDDEKVRIDFLMRTLAIAANWCFDDDNSFKTPLDMKGNFVKTWNPNFVEPYLGVLIAASLYFGGETQLNAIFTGFDYDEYLHKMSPEGFNFPRIAAIWQAAGKERMEQGTGDDGFGGKGVGVKTPFTYQNKTAGDLYGIYEVMAKRQYAKPVANGKKFKDVTAGLVSGSSPFLGQTGMMYEFDTWDAGGIRSDANYCYDSWLAGVPTRALLTVLGYWPEDSAIEKPMFVGSEDLIYKLTQGYNSYSKGKAHQDTEQKLKSQGYFYVKEVWRQFLVKR